MPRAFSNVIAEVGTAGVTEYAEKSVQGYSQLFNCFKN